MADWIQSLVIALVAGAAGGLVVRYALLPKPQPAPEEPLVPQSPINPDELKTKVLASLQQDLGAILPGLTTVVVPLPNPETKGKLIGREGRNIRAFEDITGVDLLIDERPDSVTLSSLNPRRLALAQITLQNLILDGRIHPANIDALYKISSTNLTLSLNGRVCALTSDLDVGPLSPALQSALGDLTLTHLEGQNLLSRSVEIARISAALAKELDLDPILAARAGLLSQLHFSCHDRNLGDFLKQSGESDRIIDLLTTHSGQSPYRALLSLAESISLSRPGAKRPALADLISRMDALETDLSSLPGVDRALAYRSGSEIRLFLTSNPAQTNLKILKTEAHEWATKRLGPSSHVKIVVVAQTAGDLDS